MRLALAVLVAAAVVMIPQHADAAETCTAQSSLEISTAICKTTGETITETISTAPTGTVYKTQVQCTNAQSAGGACVNPLQCAAPPGAYRYDVLRSTDAGVTFTKISEVCLTTPPPPPPPVITIAIVTEAFKAIGWGESPLVVQPPGGRTLVNLETNFYTTNAGPRVQPVTLLGQQVDIEATPSSWTWHHGDGTSQTSGSPGTAYPRLEITHTYTEVGAPLAPSVDTTYSGRYRVNGGEWAAIPDTVTVAGTPGQLEVVSAKPQLVAGE
jgi:predicted secreted Zn-dependent protease